MSRLPALKTLILDWNVVKSDADDTALSPLKVLCEHLSVHPKIEVLSVRECNLRARGMTILGESFVAKSKTYERLLNIHDDLL